MDEIFSDLALAYPRAYALLNFSSSPSLEDFKGFRLPEDFYSLYKLVSHEDEQSDGVFELNRLLPATVDSAFRDREYLRSVRLGKVAEMFIPIFQSPGRQQLGYALFDGEWLFCELDLGVEPLEVTSLNAYLRGFHEKIKNRGYVEEDELLGLIDEDEVS